MNNYTSGSAGAYADEFKRRLTAREVFEHYGFHINSSGYTCCPFHGEKTASCKVYPGDRGWHCFGCHAGGDVLDFVQKYFGLDLPHAAAKLNEDFGLGLPIGPGQDLSRAERETARKREEERRKLSAERQKRLAALEAAYNAALDKFTACDIILMRCAPISPTTGLSDAFCWAAKNIERAKYELSEADAALFRFRQQERQESSNRI